jgi:AAA+ ATPase superfamily predicted ATPase
VVAWQGKAILIPGRSYSGKTTLVEGFLRRGATYYSDEFAVFDRNGYVYPFAKPLGVREDSTQQQAKVSADSFGCDVGVKPLQAGLILFTRYEESARWRPKVISRGKAVLNLLGNAFSVRESPEAALRFAEEAVRHARILAGVRGDADEVVNTVLKDGLVA